MKKTKPGKLESQVEKAYFMGFDGESKGMRVYWAGKRLVTVKRDVYFNENEVLEPEEVQIEGEWNIPNSSTNFNSSHDTSSTLPAKSRTNETQNNDTNKQQTSENPPAITYSNNQFNNQSKAINTIPFPTPEPPINAQPRSGEARCSAKKLSDKFWLSERTNASSRGT